MILSMTCIQVFTSASTLVFKTFSCDETVREGTSYLRADYSLSCKSRLHTFFKVYAMIMIMVRKLEADHAVLRYFLYFLR